MATSDPMAILLGHDRWATAQMLDACAGLTEEQWHRRFEIGPGSLHDGLAHVVWAMHTWADTLVGREAAPQPQRRWTVAELKADHERVSGEFAAAARAKPVDETVIRSRGGKNFTYTRGGVVTHVMTHGVHHRAQCMNMLRHSGVDPLPASTVAEWLRRRVPA